MASSSSRTTTSNKTTALKVVVARRPSAKRSSAKRPVVQHTVAQPGSAESRTPPAKPSRNKPAHAPVPAPAVATVPERGRPAGKLGRVLQAIGGDRGASLAELVALTGWQPHTTRAALTRLRQRGFALTPREVDGRRAYQCDGGGSFGS